MFIQSYKRVKKNRIAAPARYNQRLMVNGRIIDQFVQVGSCLSNIQCRHNEILLI